MGHCLGGRIVIFAEIAPHAIGEAGFEGQQGTVPAPLLPLEPGRVGAGFPVVAFAFLHPGEVAGSAEGRVNGDGAAQVGLRVPVAGLRGCPGQGADVVPAGVGEGWQPGQLPSGGSEIGEVEGVSRVDVHQRSHKAGIKEVVLAHFRGPDRKLLLYCYLTLNIVKPTARPHWSGGVT